jgi:hypothetical protein
MAKLKCTAQALWNAKISVRGATYSISSAGICTEVAEEHAVLLLENPAWQRIESDKAVKEVKSLFSKKTTRTSSKIDKVAEAKDDSAAEGDVE